MVSWKWCSGESPSPMVLIAPLIPPWAQAECDLFGGTSENTLTAAPFSTALIVAIKPADPPPITIMFGLLICSPPYRNATSEFTPTMAITKNATDADNAGDPLASRTHGYPPSNAECEKPVGEMKNCRQRPDDVKKKNRRVM